MQQLPLSEIQTFLAEYRVFNHRFETQRWQNDHLAYAKLLAGWRVLGAMAAHFERRTAADYNVFYVMKNMAASEVKLHSPFLADLLNVHGQHKQGDLFYRAFLRQINLPESVYLPQDAQWFDVRTEVASGKGGIDILIAYNNGVNKFAIAIENKIYAGDQDRQLERYHEYLVQEFGDRFELIYLTIDGKLPHESSASKDFLTKYSVPCHSYRGDIIPVLRETIPHILPPHVRSTVEQYLQVCQNL